METTAVSPTSISPSSPSLLSKLPTFTGIFLVCISLIAAILGITIHTILSFVQTGYTTLSNHYVHVWMCIVLGLFSTYVLLWFIIPQQQFPKTSSSFDSRVKKLAIADAICFRAVEIGLACLVAFCSLVIFIAYLITPYDRAAAAWVWTWLIPCAVLVGSHAERLIRMHRMSSESLKVQSQEEDIQVAAEDSFKVNWCFLVLRFLRNLLFGVVLVVIAISLMVQACISSTDAIRYLPPGKLIEIEVEGVKSSLHVFCKGERASESDPIWVMEHGGGAFCSSFFGIQDILVQQGKRVCVYDRAGYGWSPLGPMPRKQGRIVAEIRQALLNLQENPPFILVGHSAGGQIIQVFASMYPESIAGLAILDSYPYYLSMLAPVMNYTQEFIKQDYDRVMATVNAARFLAPLGWIRWIAGDDPEFKPAEKRHLLLAMYGSNRAWNAQYHDFYPSNEDVIAKYVNGTTVNGVFFPQGLVKPSTPVLVMPAGKTVSADCKEEEIGCKGRKLQSAQYLKQAEAYATSISNNGTLVIVEGNGHGYPWQSPEFVAASLLNKFG